MTPGLWVSVGGLVLTSVVALIIAYLQRKQMRQIELHKADRSVPLKPPPTAFTRFLKRNWYFATLGPFNILLLVFIVVFDKHPLNRYEMAEVTFPIAGFIITLILHFQLRTTETMVGWFQRTWDELFNLKRTVSKLCETVEAIKEVQMQDGKKLSSLAAASDSSQPKQLEAPQSQSSAGEAPPPRP